MMRLRRVVGHVDFRKSEYTNFLEWAKQEKALAAQLGPHDVIAFISGGENQIVFLHGFDSLKNAEGVAKHVIYSQRLRLTDATWNAYMLANYAKMVGINLTGLRYFEDHFGYLINGKPVGSRGQLRAVG